MLAEDLTKLLTEQRTNLNNLLNASVQKKKALVDFNYDELESSIQNEEKTLSRIQLLEHERAERIKNYYKNNSMVYNTLKMSELFERVDGEIDKKSRENLLAVEKKMKEMILEINKINIQNTFLIEHSRAFIKETISSLINTNKQYLDKKI